MQTDRLEQGLEKLLSLLHASIENNEQLFADLFPSFESGETKRRRQEEFQDALDQFYLSEKNIQLKVQHFFMNLQREIEEKYLYIEKVAQEKRRDKEIKEIEKRSFNDIPRDERQQNLIEKIQKTIDQLSLQIRHLNEKITELTVLEQILKISITTRLDKIKNNYQKMAELGQGAETITIKYSYPGEKETRQLVLHFDEIFNYLKEIISEKLRDEQIAPNALFSTERELISDYITQQLEEAIKRDNSSSSEDRIKELRESQRFVSLREQVSNQVQNFREKNAGLTNELRTEIAFLAIDQSQHTQVKTAKQAIIKELALISAEQEELKKSLEVAAPKTSSSFKTLAANNSLFHAEKTKPTPEKHNQLTQAFTHVIESIKKVRSKMEKAVAQPKAAKVAANDHNGREKEKAALIINPRRLGGN